MRAISTSNTEAEYIALGHAARKAVWIRQFLNEMKLETVKSLTLHGDNEMSIALTKNAESQRYTKQIDFRKSLYPRANQWRRAYRHRPGELCIFKKYAWLGRGLVFDNEIAAQQRMWPEAHPTQFWTREGSEAAGNFGEAETWAKPSSKPYSQSPKSI